MIENFFNKHKGARRSLLFWAMWLISVVVLRATEPEVITNISAPGGTVVAAVIGLLATVLGFYQWSRSRDDNV